MLAIDFGARSIKAVKLKKTRSGYHLENFGIVLTPPGSIVRGEIKDVDAVSQALSKMLQKKRIFDKGSIIAITGQKVIVREINTPLMTDKELEEGIQWEAPKYVPYDLKESLLDVKIIEELEEKEGAKMMKVLLVAAPRSLIEQQIAVLKKARIQPKIVDIIANAQIRAFDSYFTPTPSTNEDGTLIDIILSMGASTTEITLLEGKQLKFTRTILKGSGDITTTIVNRLNIPFKEAEMLKRRIGMMMPEEIAAAEDILPDDPDNSNLSISDETESIEYGTVDDKIFTEGEEDKENAELQEKTAATEPVPDNLPSEKEIAGLVSSGVNEIFNEIRKSLNYFKTQYQKVNYKRIILCGGRAQ